MGDQSETDLLVKSETCSESDSRWTGKRLRASRRWITIEPVIFSGLIAYTAILTLRTEYLRMLISEEYKANGSSSDRTCSANTSDPSYQIEQEIQSETSLQVMYLMMCSAGLNMISGPLLSAWSDKSGRKIALFIASFGFWANAGIYLAVTYFNLSHYFLFIGETILGLSGSIILLVASSLAYVADITVKKQRMFRFVIIDTALFLAIAVSQVAMGYVVDDFGFVPSFAAAFVAASVPILYILIPPLLLETRERHSSTTATSASSKFSDLMRSIRDVLRVKEGNRHILIVVLVVLGFFMSLLFQGALGISVLLGMGAPICWTNVTVGIFTAVALFVGCLGLLIGGVTLPLCLKEYWMLYMSCLSSIASAVITGFATSTLLMFIGSIAGCIRNLPAPVIRTLLSKAVSENEQGVVFAVVGVIESVANFVSPLLLGALYSSTVQIYPGLTFFVLAGLNVVPITLTMILHGMMVRKGRFEQKDMNDNPAPIQVETPVEITSE